VDLNLIKAIIKERGHGFPSVGEYVPGNDGGCYQVVEITSEVVLKGNLRYVAAILKEADWDDEDMFPVMAVLDFEEDYRY
jgi:hypothetical protein